MCEVSNECGHWDEIEALRKRVADLEVELDRTIIAAGDMARQGYAACEADVVAQIRQCYWHSSSAADLRVDIEAGKHRGAAARKDDNG